MPYNNTPIQPPTEFTGQVSLPRELILYAAIGPHLTDFYTVARVKKIIAADDDIAQCSNNAAFVITVATEMFVQYLVERTHDVVKSERKPRRNIQYRDVSNAVARIDSLEFLSDVVPRTQRYKDFKKAQSERKVQQSARPVTRDGDVQMGGVVEQSPQSQRHPAMVQTLPYQPTSPAQQRTPQQQQQVFQPLHHSPFSQPNGAQFQAQSPGLANGHSHSRNHSLEHSGILHPQPPHSND